MITNTIPIHKYNVYLYIYIQYSCTIRSRKQLNRLNCFTIFREVFIGPGKVLGYCKRVLVPTLLEEMMKRLAKHRNFF